jgi:hypothetical protein
MPVGTLRDQLLFPDRWAPSSDDGVAAAAAAAPRSPQEGCASPGPREAVRLEMAPLRAGVGGGVCGGGGEGPPSDEDLLQLLQDVQLGDLASR